MTGLSVGVVVGAVEGFLVPFTQTACVKAKQNRDGEGAYSDAFTPNMLE